MNLLVHALGAWFATEAASGRYPRPVAVGIAMLVSRLGTPTAMLALAGLAYKKLRDEGAFDRVEAAPAARRRATRR
jgi:hypothetical protein